MTVPFLFKQGRIFKLTFWYIGHIIYLARQLEKIDEAYPLREIQVIKR